MALLGIKVSTTTPRVPFVVLDKTTQAGVTGLVASDFAVSVKRENDSAQATSITTIANVTSNYGTYQGTATNAAIQEVSKGEYILHLPYNQVASGSSFLIVLIYDKNANKNFNDVHICVALPTNTAADAVAAAASGGGGGLIGS